MTYQHTPDTPHVYGGTIAYPKPSASVSLDCNEPIPRWDSPIVCPAYVKNAEYSGSSFLRIRLAILSRFSHRPSVVITTRRRCRLPCNSTIKQQIR